METVEADNRATLAKVRSSIASSHLEKLTYQRDLGRAFDSTDVVLNV